MIAYLTRIQLFLNYSTWQTLDHLIFAVTHTRLIWYSFTSQVHEWEKSSFLAFGNSYYIIMPKDEILRKLWRSMGTEQRVADKNRHNMNHNWVCFILSRYQKLTPKAMGILQDEFEFREIITKENSYTSLALKI